MAEPIQSGTDLLLQIAGLITASAQLLWVVVAFVALMIFRPEVKDVIKRLRKGKLFGQELELGEQLQDLHKKASAAKDEVESVPSEPSKLGAADKTDGVIDRLLEEAVQSPVAALVILSRKIEQEMRRALATIGALNGRSSIPLSIAIKELNRFGHLKNLAGSVELFQRVRNTIVHGGRAVSSDDVLSAIDSGLSIMAALKALPIAKHVVLAAELSTPPLSAPRRIRRGALPNSSRRFRCGLLA
jgi:hypothetical protein